MNKLFCAGLFLLLTAFVVLPAASAGVLRPVSLWPNGAPDEKTPVGPEHDYTTAKDRKVDGLKVIRLTDVSNPTITVYQPKKKTSDAAVIVCPGGAYHILAINLEGEEVCQWLNSVGVTAVLLKYRVPMRAGDERHLLPLQDAQRALGYVRHHAAEWNVNTNKIGILGFSAGGHLTAHLCASYEQRAYPPIDENSQASCRPDFAILIYPAYLTTKDKKELAPEIKVTPQTPPTFLTQTEDDPVFVECSIRYYLALKENKVPAEMHIYPHGGHGYGLRPSRDEVSSWPKRAEEWMRARGLLESKH